MRPRRLVAEGFTAFRDPIDVNFEGVDFFSFVGPTGSGKSSILDAMCFALYGSVPRYDDDRLVAPAISQGANEARVSLTFELDGDEYVATRVVRRTKGGASTREARLERADEVLAGDAREMNARVAALIGLSFHDFTRCVVLPQGEFAEFLHDKPSDRQDLIVKLLDLQVYERMGQRARARAAEGENAITLDEARLRDLADCTPEAEAAERDTAANLKMLLARLREADNLVQALEQEAADATKQAAAARAVVGSLRAVKVPRALRTLAGERAEAVEIRARAAADREAADAALDASEQAIAALPDPVGLQQLLDAYDQLADVEAEIADIAAEEAAQVPLAEHASAGLDEAERALHIAEHAYDAAVEDTAATDLASGLVVGEPCPVCEQVVTRKPAVRKGEKARAAKAREAARKNEASARKARDKVVKEGDALAVRRQALATRASTLKRKVARQPAAEAIAQQLEAITAAQIAHAALQTEAKQVANREREAVKRIAVFDEQVADARRTYDEQREPLLIAGLDAPPVATDLVAAWEAIERWAREQIPIQTERERVETTRANARTTAVRDQINALVGEVAAAGVVTPRGPDPTIGRLRELVAAAEQTAKTEAVRVARGIKESASITKRIENVRGEVAVAAALAQLLRANRFEQWIVKEALGCLVDGASETLEQLSNGQYALAVDERNEFEVIDHRNADERRSAKTLSGGETFQASLALALALADQVGALAAGGAAKLDAIFLDEGFGTLDAESLDTVAGTLETLGGDTRMVGLVTHVRDLAERVPVRFEVTKGPRTSTVTRVEA